MFLGYFLDAFCMSTPTRAVMEGEEDIVGAISGVSKNMSKF